MWNVVLNVPSNGKPAIANVDLGDSVFEIAITPDVARSESCRNTRLTALDGLVRNVVRASLETFIQAVHVRCLEIVARIIDAVTDLVVPATYWYAAGRRITAT